MVMDLLKIGNLIASLWPSATEETVRLTEDLLLSRRTMTTEQAEQILRQARTAKDTHIVPLSVIRRLIQQMPEEKEFRTPVFEVLFFNRRLEDGFLLYEECVPAQTAQHAADIVRAMCSLRWPNLDILIYVGKDSIRLGRQMLEKIKQQYVQTKPFVYQRRGSQ